MALLIAVAVGALPLSTVLQDHVAGSPASAKVHSAPPVHPDGPRTKEADSISIWATLTDSPILWPPITRILRSQPTARPQAGHPTRIDRPPSA